MAKTESTAVNSLIELVQSNQAQPVIDPTDDLFGAPKKAPPAKASPVATRSSIPSLRGAEVAPLPRSRAPGGTSQLTLPEHRPSVRSTTAPPSRGTTIPPIPQRVATPAPRLPSVPPEGTPPPALQARPALPPPVRATSSPALPPPVRATSSPALPPPTRSTPSPAQAPAAKRASSPSPAALYAKSQTGPASLAVVAPLSYPAQHQARIDMTGDMVRGEDWFEASRAVEKFEDETYVGTSPHVLHDRRAESTLIKKLILPGIGFIIVGALIGGFIALNSSGKKKVVAKAPIVHVTPMNQPTAQNAALAAQVAQGANPGAPSTELPNAATATASANGERPEPPAPTTANALPNADRVAAAVPAETAETHVVQTTRGVVRLADVRIDSLPAGATVTLVEKTATGEKKSFLGTTPIATSLDASRTYEVVLALQGRPAQTAKLDPAHTPHLQIALAKATKSAPSAPAQPAIAKAAPAQPAIAKAAPKATAPKHHSAPKSEQLADPGFDSVPAPAEAPDKSGERPTRSTGEAGAKVSEKPEKPAASGGNGSLMISTKPPCEIMIDGKSTGLTTPQRAISLPAGAHKVTLVNSGANINKTLMVQINPDQSTKLVKDLIPN